MPEPTDSATAFGRLHEAGCFVMPNPWDVGSARVLTHLGFPALATTSAGFAWTSGHQDNLVDLDRILAHLSDIVGAVNVPVNADFEGGFAVAPDQVAANVGRAVGTGIAGLSIEDSTGDEGDPLFGFELAVERIAAARQSIDASGTAVILTGRTEGFIVGRPDLAETVRRLTAYAEAGADCLYAPGLTTADQIATVVAAVAPKPVNLLINQPFCTVAEAADLGVRRISVGGALAKAAWGSFLSAATEIARDGTFSRLAGTPDVNALLAPDGTEG
ncbi:MAG: isocitrate lyase/phosphoenolpyruvate mutase family protein [Propionibacteriales bacterium]|nr:isocitrate lyase/phosphoenolpyruvate mutase family protein [Propionibacteriales bacterium]